MVDCAKVSARASAIDKDKDKDKGESDDSILALCCYLLARQSFEVQTETYQRRFWKYVAELILQMKN